MRVSLSLIALFLTACSTSPGQDPALGAPSASSARAALSSSSIMITDSVLSAKVEAAFRLCVTRTMTEAKQQNKDAAAEVFDPANRRLAEGACGMVREACARGKGDAVCAGLLAEYR